MRRLVVVAAVALATAACAAPTQQDLDRAFIGEVSASPTLAAAPPAQLITAGRQSCGADRLAAYGSFGFNFGWPQYDIDLLYDSAHKWYCPPS